MLSQMARFCFLVLNNCYLHHCLSSGRESFSQLMLSRLLEGREDTPDLGRAACRRREEEDHGSPLHNSEIQHLQTRSSLHALSSSVLEIISVLFSYFHSESPRSCQEPRSCPSSLSLPTHCTGGKRHLGFSGKLWGLHTMWPLPIARFLPPALLGGDR